MAPPDFLIVDPPTAGLQRLRASFSGHAYDRHRHETYAVGITEAGLQCLHYRGTARASTTGRVIVIYPDEVHDGHAGAPSGFVYSMLYTDPSLIAAALGGRALPFCGEPVFDDPELRRILADAFVDFPEPIEDLAAAYAAGFADQSHMTRQLKSRFGLTPGRYAALLRSGRRHIPIPAEARQSGARTTTLLGSTH